MFKLIISFLVLIFIVTSPCFAENESKMKDVLEDIHQKYADVTYISVSQLREWLDNKDMIAPLIIDVREKEEYAVSHLPQAIWVGSKKRQVLRFLEKENRGKVVLYCSVGARSANMARWLTRRGIKDVYNLEGSIFQWANEGYPVFKGKEQVEKVHPFNQYWGRFLEEK